MAVDIKLSDVILKSFVEGKIGELDRKCAADKDACGDVAITQDQEDVIAYVLNDGKVTAREKEMLGFLPSDVVSGVAGNGMKPARMKADALVKRLRIAKPDEITPIMDELVQLDPSIRVRVLPEVKRILGNIGAERVKAKLSYNRSKSAFDRSYARKASQIDVLEERIASAEKKYSEMQRGGYTRINNMDLSRDGVVRTNMLTALEQKFKRYYSSHVQPLRDQMDRLDEECDNLVEPHDPSVDYSDAEIAMKGFVDGSLKASVAWAPASVMPFMTVDELYAQVREVNNKDAFLTMIERFPQNEKTIELCSLVLRKSSQEFERASQDFDEGVKDADDRLSGRGRAYVRQRSWVRERYNEAMEKARTNPVTVKALEHVGRFRSRLEPVINDIPDELLPALFASNPKENVSDLVIERIMSCEKGKEWNLSAFAADSKKAMEWKLAALAAGSEKADHVTFERIVAAVKGSGLDHEFSRLSSRYERASSAEFSRSWAVDDRESAHAQQVKRIEHYARCTAGEFGEIDEDTCDEPHGWRYDGADLSEKHRVQIRTAMENGATKLYFMSGEMVSLNDSLYLDGDIVGAKEE